MTFVIGIDIGGTFTDAFATDEEGRTASAKAPSTPDDLARGVLDAVEELGRTLGLSSTELLSETASICHGTTASLNALVTGGVARVGFLTTRGHADSIAIMNLEGRYAGLGQEDVQNMSRTNKPAPLVPRSLVREIDERIDHKGSVIAELDEAAARTAIEELVAAGVEAIAVSLLWSFRNPAHENRLHELITEIAPEVYVGLSSVVSPRIREYPRSATTIMSAQVAPKLRDYLVPLEERLRNEGFDGSLLVMQGSGGTTEARDAEQHAISTIGSVLTGGVIGCVELGGRLGHRNIISTDMGGTTFLVGLVVDGEPVKATTTILNQHIINIPMVKVDTIGAGGGAIAWIDPGGNLRVGPRSAQAQPGPACYGNGGTEPTVTDADVVLGIIDPDYFLGGRTTLHRHLAEAAIREKVAEPLGLTVEDAAAAIYEIQNAQAADLVRRVVVDSGYDPRDFVLYAFGGAGPVHCASYAANLDAQSLVVPMGTAASAFSAYGLAAADIVLSSELSRPSSFPLDPVETTATFEGLESKLLERIEAQGVPLKGVTLRREVDVRFTLQLAEVATPVPLGKLTEAEIAETAATFERRYVELYGEGTGFREAGLQAITLRVFAVGEPAFRPKLGAHEEDAGEHAPLEPVSSRRAFLGTREFVEAAVYRAEDLRPGHELRGPAIVEATTTTVALPEGAVATLDPIGDMTITFTSEGGVDAAVSGAGLREVR